MNWIYEPWSWYMAGPLIALVLLVLLLIGKNLGMSSNLRTICTMCGAGKNVDFFKFNWRAQQWNLIVVLGVILGGFIANNYLSKNTKVELNAAVIADLQSKGFVSAGKTYLPEQLFSNTVLAILRGSLY